jgi:pyruvate/2-oxoacid:ferredoxin oxidoreductase beta subunit
MSESSNNCHCDIFSPCEEHFIAKPLNEITYETVQIEMLRWELMQWKKKYARLLMDIKTEKKEKEQLSLDVTTWQARFLSLSAKFQNLKSVTKELDLWFSKSSPDE